MLGADGVRWPPTWSRRGWPTPWATSPSPSSGRWPTRAVVARCWVGSGPWPRCARCGRPWRRGRPLPPRAGSSWPRPVRSAPGSSGPSRSSSGPSTGSARRCTCAARSCTTPTWWPDLERQRGGVRRGARRGARRRHRRAGRPRRLPRGPWPGCGAPGPVGHRRDLPAGGEGPPRGPAVRRPGAAHRPGRARRPRRGGRHDGRGARRASTSSRGSTTWNASPTAPTPRSPTSPRPRWRSTRPTRSSRRCGIAFTPWSARARTTSATPRQNRQDAVRSAGRPLRPHARGRLGQLLQHRPPGRGRPPRGMSRPSWSRTPDGSTSVGWLGVEVASGSPPGRRPPSRWSHELVEALCAISDPSRSIEHRTVEESVRFSLPQQVR